MQWTEKERPGIQSYLEANRSLFISSTAPRILTADFEKEIEIRTGTHLTITKLRENDEEVISVRTSYPKAELEYSLLHGIFALPTGDNAPSGYFLEAFLYGDYSAMTYGIDRRQQILPLIAPERGLPFLLSPDAGTRQGIMAMYAETLRRIADPKRQASIEFSQYPPAQRKLFLNDQFSIALDCYYHFFKNPGTATPIEHKRDLKHAALWFFEALEVAKLMSIFPQEILDARTEQYIRMLNMEEFQENPTIDAISSLKAFDRQSN